MSKAEVAQKSPYEVELEEGKRYAWCSCGKSQNQPFCDGAHKGTEFRPLVFTAEKTGTAWLCGCKQLQEGPFCDGTHNQIDD